MLLSAVDAASRLCHSTAVVYHIQGVQLSCMHADVSPSFLYWFARQDWDWGPNPA